MDFRAIRKKAQERAAARAGAVAGSSERHADPVAPAPSGAAGAPARVAGDAPPRRPPIPSPDPARARAPVRARGGADAAAEPPDAAAIVADVEALDRALAARLDGTAELAAPETARAASTVPALAPGSGSEPTQAGARFVTWRPGVEPPPELPAHAPEATRADPDAFVTLSPRASGDPTAGPREGDPLDDFFYRADEDAPPLPDLAPAVPPGVAPEPATVLEEFLTFLLGCEEYAVPIGRVREVVKAPPITEVPRAPAGVLGVVTVRGEVVAVFDPRRRLGLGAHGDARGARGARIVILDAGQGPCGLLVDAVASVVRLQQGAIEPCPQGIGGGAAECLAGVGRDRDRLFTVLDVAALLRRPAGPTRAAEAGSDDA